ncbi:MAG: hypothetical protein CSYNP_00393 [Syntrophus sp. SKADARSKE-3]|nr:hypothetical protein [Syntrophus sp. SKADARSKE-3]
MSFPSCNNRKQLCNRGFAIIGAIIVCVILFALAMLVIHISTSDLQISARSVGAKKALMSAETGLSRLIQRFDPASAAPPDLYDNWTQVDADPACRYRITQPVALRRALLALPGYSMEAGKGYGMAPYTVTITGENTSYNTRAQLDVGVGYAPVPVGTSYQ